MFADCTCLQEFIRWVARRLAKQGVANQSNIDGWLVCHPVMKQEASE